ncbi:MAG: COX15/CtaA family protein [Thermodesulfobacteriota bacterium]
MTLVAYAAIVLAWNVAVILWGAFVRATGSGAGCGAHWPLCNGEVLPRAPEVETLIELTHRVTSGVALLLVVGLLVWAVRVRPRGDRARTWAVASMVFIVTEALLGAGLVLFELVAHDASSMRAFAMVAHLLNTFALLAALTLTVRWAATPPRAAASAPPLPPLPVAALLAVVAIAATGAIAALGDTLFPARSLAEGLRQDFSATAHFLLRLRVLHPILGVALGALVVATAAVIAVRHAERGVRVTACVVVATVLLQLACGFANLLLLAPVWLQLVHLLLADALWIELVVLTSVVRQATLATVVQPAAGAPATLVAGAARKG